MKKYNLNHALQDILFWILVIISILLPFVGGLLFIICGCMGIINIDL